MTKPIFKGTIECPWCKKQVAVRVEREIIEPALPAQTKINVFVDKQGDLTEIKGDYDAS